MTRALIYELSRGLAYRRINHSKTKLYTTWLPAVLTISIVSIYWTFPVRPVITGKDGLAASILALVSTLPGFYFVGLAAVATFGNNTMDMEMPTPAPEIEMLVSGSELTVKLTRRLFLSYLFSYLVVISFILSIALIALVNGSAAIYYIRSLSLLSTNSSAIWILFKFLVITALTFLGCSMAVSTLHGVYFLTEKIHQP